MSSLLKDNLVAEKLKFLAINTFFFYLIICIYCKCMYVNHLDFYHSVVVKQLNAVFLH